MSSKFEKNKKNFGDSSYNAAPNCKYCWDVTVYKGNEDAEEPSEMIYSRVGIQEEILLKVTEGFD